MTDKIREIATKMYAHCIRKDAGEMALKSLKDEAAGLLRQYAEGLGIGVEDAEVNQYKRQQGCIPEKCADNARDMLDGALNRMAVGEGESEKREMYETALYHINVIYDEAMEACGFYEVPVWKWENPIKL